MGKFLVLQFFVYCCFRMLSSQMAAVWWFCDLCVLVVLEVSVCVCPKMTSHWILQVPDAASLLVQQRSAVLLRSAKKKKTFTLVCVLARKLARSAWLCSAEFVYRDFFFTPQLLNTIMTLMINSCVSPPLDWETFVWPLQSLCCIDRPVEQGKGERLSWYDYYKQGKQSTEGMWCFKWKCLQIWIQSLRQEKKSIKSHNKSHFLWTNNMQYFLLYILVF